MDFTVPDVTLDEWISELKPYQKNSINQLLANKEPEEVAKAWLTSQGAINTIHFGGVKDSKPFWDNFINEFNKFLCDERAYKEEKERLKGEIPVSKTILIYVISATLGAKIGFSAALFAPAVTLLLFSVGKMTKNAYCETYYKG